MSVWTDSSRRQAGGVDVVGRLWAALSNKVMRLSAAYRIARQRRELAELDDRMLHDIGITRFEARQEAARGFWYIPTDLLRR
jgi:uncharacterized protein YjiS (DUF1127 family)